MAGKILKYLPKATSFPITRNTISNKNFSGPISLIPQEVRRKKNYGASEENEEPRSPKVSCIGQVKKKKKAKKTKKPSEKQKVARLVSSVISRMFGKKVRPERRDGHGEVAEVPEIGKMRRCASSRETLKDFDWKKAAHDDEVLVAHSAPILVCGGVVALEPRKEVNIWKRRTFAPPMSLEVKQSH